MRFRDKLQIELISFLCVAAGFTACQEYDETGRMPQQEGKPVTVSLQLGLSDETDAYTLGPASSAPTKSETSVNANVPFVAELMEQKTTKAADLKPDGLYELHIIQYTSGGNLISSVQYRQGKTDLGSHLDIQLQTSDDCQLVIIARGKDNTSPSIGGNMTNLQSLAIPQTVFDAIPTSTPTQEQINKMPYVLHLPKVKITADPNNTSNGIIQSPDGSIDTRLMLKRLAAKLNVTWNINPALTTNGYNLKEVKLCQVPQNFYILPAREETQWGTTYPTSVAPFIEKYRLTGSSLTGVTSKEIWIPANVRGTSPQASSPIYRNKENAPEGASYMEVVIDNADKKERLYYRAYLGGKEITDFNLYENTNYDWTININNTDYQKDPRIQLLDQTPVKSTNKVATANCFMLPPGGNICFNPYRHTAGTNGWNDRLVTNPASSPSITKAITQVKVLWQTKDAGTSGDLVMGYIIDNDHHENLVNITDAGNINDALVHVKVPLTQGGNAVIAAYNGNTVLWSWHIWVTDYRPVPMNASVDNNTARANAIAAAQNATKNGMVHTYGGTSWTEAAGSFYKCVIMDRNLGATRAGIQQNLLDAVRTFGLLYQGGRKDPFFSTADGTPTETKTIYNGYGNEVDIAKVSNNNYNLTIQNPLTFYKGLNSTSDKWGGDGKKTIDDPCPEGWRVPSNEYLNNVSKGPASNFGWIDGDRLASLFAGFGRNDASYVSEGYLNSLYDKNLMYYNGSSFSQIGKGNEPSSTVVGSGYIYFGSSGETPNNYTNKSAYFPGVSLRESGSGNYRTSTKNNTIFLWSSSKNNTNNAMHMYEIQYDPRYYNAGTLGLLGFMHTNPSGYGFSVRCIQDNIQDRNSK